ncbi:uncharacterized protein LOC129574495 [Sitodiplosis mosellana]|uniref:uncharacterized protein LOC129574495 n=1 Tax=Sitodiplosis mosellana TaxID=263140 RepID=UPI002445261F|nr:uncharacterized protein LOC129574495 [Sitodiplosis mosellana]
MQSLDRQHCSQTQAKHDVFCWTCHKDKPNLFCSTCVRSFHISASCSHVKKMIATDKSGWRCLECIEVEKDVFQMKTNKMETGYLNELLNYISKLLQADQYLADRFLDVEYGNKRGPVCNPLDLTRVGEKTEYAEYTCIEDFWSDIKWIVHNTKVHRSGDKYAIEGLKWLTKFTKNEIYTIRLCHECYRNANQNPKDWFTKPCAKPHILVWVQQKGYPYYPAKLMAVNNDKHTVDVQFFGQHERMVLKPEDSACHIYSEKCPSSSIGSSKYDWEKAVNEARVYIQNLVEMFGSFHYAAPNTILNKDKLDRHLYEMIPKALKMVGITEIPSPIPKTATAARRMTIASIFADGAPRRKSISVRRRKSVAFDANQVELDCDPDFIPTGQKRKLDILHDLEPLPLAKKQRVEDSSNSIGTRVENGQSNEVPTSVGAASIPSVRIHGSHVPASVLPVRARKTFPNSTLRTFNPSNSEFSHRPINEASSSATAVLLKEEQESLSDQNSMDNLILHYSDSDEVVSPQSKCKQEEMVALCNALSGTNAPQMTECIRSSLETTLVDLTATTDAAKQIQLLQNELEKQRIENDILGNKNNQLTKQNGDLIQELVNVNQKLDVMTKRNAELVTVNKVLTQSTEKFKVEIGQLGDRIKGECKVEQAKLIAETKQTKWCAACGLPCGRYYCSFACEEHARKPQRS